MNEARDIADRYIATWNEKDAAARADLIARHWTEKPRYADPLMAADGAAELSGIIGAVQDRFPDFVFRLIDTPDGHGDYARFSWGLGPDGSDPVIEGSDVVEASKGRIVRVIGFLDKLPTS